MTEWLTAKALLGLTRWMWIAIAAVAVIGGAVAIVKIHDHRVVQADRDKANLQQLKDQQKADTHAADQRVADVTAQHAQQEAYHNAIHSPQAGDASDPDVRLACEQLRRSGQATAAIPACGGR